MRSKEEILPTLNIGQLIVKIKQIEFDVMNNKYIFRDIKGNEIVVDKDTYLKLCEYLERR